MKDFLIGLVELIALVGFLLIIIKIGDRYGR